MRACFRQEEATPSHKQPCMYNRESCFKSRVKPKETLEVFLGERSHQHLPSVSFESKDVIEENEKKEKSECLWYKEKSKLTKFHSQSDLMFIINCWYFSFHITSI